MPGGLFDTSSPQVFLSDTAPLSEAGTASAGVMPTAPRADHRHPRLSAVPAGTLDANGSATILPFSRTFSAVPGLNFIAIENTTDDAPRFKVQRFLKQDGSTWTTPADGAIYGCVIYGSRARALPALSGILLIGPLVTALSGYLPSQPAANVAFTGIAIQPTVTA